LKNMHLEVLSLGTIYPQALLVFTMWGLFPIHQVHLIGLTSFFAPPPFLLYCSGITYSVIAPMILVFGTIYFGMAYLVYKYKVLNGKSQSSSAEKFKARKCLFICISHQFTTVRSKVKAKLGPLPAIGLDGLWSCLCLYLFTLICTSYAYLAVCLE
jgi:hypothetical protein